MFVILAIACSQDHGTTGVAAEAKLDGNDLRYEEMSDNGADVFNPGFTVFGIRTGASDACDHFYDYKPDVCHDDGVTLTEYYAEPDVCDARPVKEKGDHNCQTECEAKDRDHGACRTAPVTIHETGLIPPQKWDTDEDGERTKSLTIESGYCKCWDGDTEPPDQSTEDKGEPWDGSDTGDTGGGDAGGGDTGGGDTGGGDTGGGDSGNAT